MGVRKHWREHPLDETVYGFHRYGIGVYRFIKDTYEPVEFWLDYESATPEEVVRYEQYLKENDWEE